MTAESNPTCRELCLFLSQYGAALLGSGATCIRLTKNVGRIAGVFGRQVELTVMPRHIHISVLGRGDEEMVTMIASPAGTISFNTNTRLSRLSWEVADGHIGFDEMKNRFRNIISSDRRNPLQVLLLASCANASFCRLFGGDAVALAVVFVATLAGYYLKTMLLGRHVDLRVVMMVCAFVSSVLGATDMLFSLGSTPEVALGTSVLYLVPGVPFLNSFSDLLYRHYVCAFSRFTDALILTCCLSAGLFVGILLMDASIFRL